MPIRWARCTALMLGVAVLAWQGVNASRGRFVHDFLIPDLILGVGLIVAAWPKDDRRAAVAMLAAFSAMGAVFLCATAMRWTGGGYDLGTALTTLGLLPCLGWTYALGRRLGGRS